MRAGSKPIFILATLIVAATASAADSSSQAGQSIKFTGPHGFDFEIGEWKVHHRIKRQDRWIEMEGTCIDRPAMDGSANIEEHTFERPEGITRGMAVRAFDPKTGLWAIWWIDSRNPHVAMDPPMKGSFVNGVGTFYAEGPVNGQTIRTRFLWSHITRSSARWEQASSSDDGKTWDTNWVMEFARK
jgi:hypothetical protein